MTAEPHTTDEQIIEQHRAGDAAAFPLLIERHHDALMRFLARFTGSATLAEDVFQEAFLQVHQSLDSFDTSRRFKPWLFTIAANKARDALRRQNRRKALSLSATAGDEGPAYVDLMAIDLPAPGASADNAEQSALVQRALDSMPEHQREILLLAYFQKLSYQQAADVLGIPLGTVKSRLHAAVAAFARAWQAQQTQRTAGPAQDASG